MAITITLNADPSSVDTALGRLQGAIDQRMTQIERRLDLGQSATQQFSERSSRHLKTVEQSTESLTRRFESLTVAIAGFYAAVQAGGILGGFIRDVALTAARTETLNVVLMQVAKNAGITALQAGVARDRIKALGITTQEASQITARFIQANLDLTKAIELANVARNAAVVADQNTSQALNGIVQGILTLQQETLRTYGIFVNLSQANEAFANAAGRTVESLTISERQQIALNATLQAGVALQGTYEASLGTVGKQITSLTRIIEESRNVLGNNYLPILGRIIGAITDMLVGFQQLPPAVQTGTAALLGAAAAVGVLTVAVAALVRVGQALAITSLFTGWGPVIFAIGAAAAAAIALTKALQGVSSFDPATVLKQSTTAIDERIRSTEKLLSVQTSSLEKMQEGLKATPESKTGAEVIARQTLRVQELKNALDALRVTRDQLSKPVQLPPPRPVDSIPPPPDTSKALQATANLAKAQEQIIEQSLKRQEALIAQSFDERRALADTAFAEEVRAAPGEAEQITRARTEAMRQIAQEEATILEQVRLDANDRLLAATIDQLNKEKAAHAGKVADIAKIDASLQVVYEEHGTQREAILARTAAIRQQLSKQATDEEIKDIIRANDIMEKSREQALEDFAKQTREIEQEMAREQDRIQTSQLRSYENFVNRVAGMLNDIFTGLLNGTLSAVDFFKQLLIAQLANIGSSVIAPFVASIAASVAGVLSSALPSALGNILGQGVFGPAGTPEGGLAAIGGTALQGAGVLNSLIGPQSLFGTFLSQTGPLATAFSQLTSILNTGASAVGGGIADLITNVTGIPVTNLPASGLTALGGLAGVGGGIFSALNAQGIGGQAGGAFGAAGGLAAVVSGLGLIAPAIGPIGLALAALAPLLGNFVDTLGSPAGPRFGLGGLGGVGIGAGPGGLQVTGSVTSQIGRQARIPGGVDTAEIQDQLNASVTRIVHGMVNALNEVSVDPTALLEPTQQALNDALSDALRINSSNAKNFQQDMEDQLKFVGTQVGSFFLRPLNEAFRQLESAELDQQISRLPQTTQGMVAVFRGMNTQLDELSKVANTDVLRQLSGVRNQVQNFGNALADTARVISTSIVDQISDQLIAQANMLLDAPLAQQITRFGAVMNQSFAALNSLRTTQRSLQEGGLNAGGVTGQLERLSTFMVDTATRVSTDIVTGALSELAANLDRVLIQPIRVQATTVNSLFTQSLQALDTLWQQWHRLADAGIDASQVQGQFERLLGGALSSVQRLREEAFKTESLTDFLNVLLSIPEALTNMNPVFQQVRQLGLAFAQVAQPIQQVIEATQIDLQTPGERAADTAQQVRDLQDAITDAGSAIDQVLPLYTQMAQAIQANAQAQIDVVNAQAEAQTEAINTAFDGALEAVNRWADEATTAVNTAFDAQMDALNTWADDATQAWNTWADDMTTVINTAAEAAIDAWNDWADQMTAGVNQWTETMTKAVNDWAQSAQTTASQLSSVNDTLLSEMSPAQQRATLEAQKAQLEAVVGGGGPGAQRALDELIRVNQQLLSLAKQSDNLALQKQSIDELRRIQKYLTDQLVAATGFSDPVLAQIAVALTQEAWLKEIAAIERASIEYIQQVQTGQLESIRLSQEAQLAYVQQVQTAQLAAIAMNQELQTQALIANQQAQLQAIAQTQAVQTQALNEGRAQQLREVVSWQEATVRAIKEDMVSQLQGIQQQLRNIFALQYLALTGTQLPGVQRGGIVGLASGLHYAQGGMVPVLLEPGERVFHGPMTRAQEGALMGINRAFPRFAQGGWTVPGSGTGDSVPAWVPSGSFVLNRRAAGTLGYQNGGSVQGPSASSMPPIVIDLKYSTFGSPEDARKVKQIIERDVIKIVEDYNRRIKVDTRLK